MNNFLYNKLASAYFWLFTVNALCNAITISLLNSEWGSLSPTTKFVTVALIIQNWSTVMLAFINKSAARVAEDKPILPTTDGNTTEITKEQVNEKPIV